MLQLFTHTAAALGSSVKQIVRNYCPLLTADTSAQIAFVEIPVSLSQTEDSPEAKLLTGKINFRTIHPGTAASEALGFSVNQTRASHNALGTTNTAAQKLGSTMFVLSCIAQDRPGAECLSCQIFYPAAAATAF